MSPFEALYSYAPPILIPFFASDLKNETVDMMLKEREEMKTLLKQKIEMAQ